MVRILIASAVILIVLAVTYGTARSHDPYDNLMHPVTGKSCCRAQSPQNPHGDCRAGAVWRDENGDLRARIDGVDRIVPESALIPDHMNPHPPTGMICEKYGFFYCVALSGAGG